jgi:hypothetical protein
MAQQLFPDTAAADVPRGENAPYVAGDQAQPLTQTPEGRLRVTAEEKLLGAILDLTDEVRQLRAAFELVNGL